MGNSALVRIRAQSRFVRAIAFSLAFISGEFASAQQEPPKLHASIKESEIRGAIFSPDGGTLLIRTGDSSFRLWDVATQSVRSKLDNTATLILTMAYAPDGRTVAIADLNVIRRLDLRTGKSTKVYGQKGEAFCLAFSADGKSLAISEILPSDETGPRARVWDFAAAKQIPVKGSNVLISDLAFFPDGKTLALAGADSSVGSVRGVWLCDLAGAKEPRVLSGYKHAVGRLAISPDGKTLVTTGDGADLWVWDARTAKLREKWNVGFEMIQGIVFSPDARILVAAGGPIKSVNPRRNPGRVAFLDAATGKVILSFDALPHTIGRMSLSRNGRLLAVSSEQASDEMRVFDVSPLTGLKPAQP